MGIIQQQSIKGFIYSYLGVILGFITTGYLMPEYLEQDEIGLLRVMVSYATLLAQFSSLGFSIVIIRMFPYFRDPASRNHGVFGLFSIISLIGFALSLGGFFLYYQYYLQYNIADLFNRYIFWVVPLTLFILLYILADSYHRSLYDAIKGTIVKELVQRLLIFIAITLFILNIYDLNGLVAFYVFAFLAPPLLMLFPLIKNKSISLIPDFKFIDKELRSKIIGVSIFGLISSFSNILVLNIDVLMVERYLGLSNTGIYTISFFFGALVLIPSRPLTRISAIVVADSFKANDLKNINLIYKKSSINLTIVAVFLTLGLLINLENIISLIGHDYRSGLLVIVFIALANIIQMSSGVLNQIVFNSKYYKYSSYFIFIYVILIIISNMMLIPKYGISGAAIATFISKFVFVFMRIIFVQKKLNLFPYQAKTIVPFLIAIALYFVQSYFLQADNYILDIFIRSSLVSIAFISTIYLLNISEDLTKWTDQMLSKLK